MDSACLLNHYNSALRNPTWHGLRLIRQTPSAYRCASSAAHGSGKTGKCGLSQREVSNRLGIDSHTFISAIESGGPSLPEDRWEEYAQILGIDWPEFCKNMIMYFKPDIYRGLFGEPSKTETQQGKKA